MHRSVVLLGSNGTDVALQQWFLLLRLLVLFVLLDTLVVVVIAVERDDDTINAQTFDGRKKKKERICLLGA